MSPTSRRSGAAALAALALVPAAYAAGAARDAPAQATREALAQAVDPAGAQGRTLGLSRVTIPAHTRLGLHHHAGTQIAYVQKGTLTYTARSRCTAAPPTLTRASCAASPAGTPAWCTRANG